MLLIAKPDDVAVRRLPAAAEKYAASLELNV